MFFSKPFLPFFQKYIQHFYYLISCRVIEVFSLNFMILLISPWVSQQGNQVCAVKSTLMFSVYLNLATSQINTCLSFMLQWYFNFQKGSKLQQDLKHKVVAKPEISGLWACYTTSSNHVRMSAAVPLHSVFCNSIWLQEKEKERLSVFQMSLI